MSGVADQAMKGQSQMLKVGRLQYGVQSAERIYEIYKVRSTIQDQCMTSQSCMNTLEGSTLRGKLNT